MATHRSEFLSCDFPDCNETQVVTPSPEVGAPINSAGPWVRHRFAVILRTDYQLVGTLDLCSHHSKEQPRDLIHSGHGSVERLYPSGKQPVMLDTVRSELRGLGMLVVKTELVKDLVMRWVQDEEEAGGTPFEVREALRAFVLSHRAEGTARTDPAVEEIVRLAYDEKDARRESGGGDDRTVVVLRLDKYERDNLLWLINAIGYPAGVPRIPVFEVANTGDWVGQIGSKLKPGERPVLNSSNNPNMTLEELGNRVFSEIGAWARQREIHPGITSKLIERFLRDFVADGRRASRSDAEIESALKTLLHECEVTEFRTCELMMAAAFDVIPPGAENG